MNTEFIDSSSPVTDFVLNNWGFVSTLTIIYFFISLNQEFIMSNDFDVNHLINVRNHLFDNSFLFDFSRYQDLRDLKRCSDFYKNLYMFFNDYREIYGEFELPKTPYSYECWEFIYFIQSLEIKDESDYIFLINYPINYSSIRLISDQVLFYIKSTNGIS